MKCIQYLLHLTICDVQCCKGIFKIPFATTIYQLMYTSNDELHCSSIYSDQSASLEIKEGNYFIRQSKAKIPSVTQLGDHQLKADLQITTSD